MHRARATKFAAVGLAIGVVVGSSAGIAIGFAMGHVTGNRRVWLPVCTSCGCALAANIGVAMGVRRSRRGEHECPACGYQVRGLPGRLCPECGVDYEALRRELAEEDGAAPAAGANESNPGTG